MLVILHRHRSRYYTTQLRLIRFARAQPSIARASATSWFDAELFSFPDDRVKRTQKEMFLFYVAIVFTPTE